MDKAILERVQRQAWFHRYPRGFPIGLLLFALLLTAVAIIAIERSERQSRSLRVEAQGREMAAALQRRATETVAYLVAGSSVFSVQGRVTPEMFAMYGFDRSTSLQERGALGIGYAPWVRTSDLPEFVALQSSTWPAGRTVFPDSGSRNEFSAPIALIEPRNARNAAALGFDMYSEPERRAAMDRARQSDRPAMTGIVHLIQDGPDTKARGFLIYVPVKLARAAGQRELIGYVYGAFRAEEFLRSAAELVEGPEAEIALYDQFVSAERLLAGRSDRSFGKLGVTVSLTVAQRDLKLVLVDRQSASLSLLSQIVAAFGIIVGGILMGVGLYVTHRAAEDRRVLEWLTNQGKIRNALSRELNHRVKNTLANVLSIVSLTRRRSSTVEEFAEGLIGRLRALSATQDLLVQREWVDAPVGDVVRSELAPYMQVGDSHVRMDGPEVAIAPNDALSLGLAVHELATNAAKYGALSVPGGQIEVHWMINPSRQVELYWRESGGPPVVKPTKRGFGSDLIERIVAHELQNDVTIDFDPAGVSCRLIVPLRDRSEFAIRQPA